MKIIKAFGWVVVLGALFNLYFSLINGSIGDVVSFVVFLGCGLLGYLSISLLFQKNKSFQNSFTIQIITIFIICTILEIVYGLLVGLKISSIFMMILLGIPIVFIGFVYWWQYSKRINNKLLKKQQSLLKEEKV
ncbi:MULTISPECIES: hypothetical protein [Lactococcus]|jgi:hypothetical protein|uniref:hypothetical protein n=1 Tax=Lactococcus TaxID=1357 RepID=UPI00024D9139|nr:MULTISPECIES: hypothetical protein [Lactococcus]MCA2381584.1 hypothetical protein [Lactococcus sp. SK2-659]MCI2139785.1 hypothetical protein [Lactococcus lactis]MCI2190430.1 hypothetical protein [Lactococcus lactis]THA53029.1 hypothetical protein E5555_08510 [Lactococcus lactis]BAL51206.1 lactococcin A ABC transporter ATP binding and permease protein [Lactococcus lactis subsp. lactis IO-1]